MGAKSSKYASDEYLSASSEETNAQKINENIPRDEKKQRAASPEAAKSSYFSMGFGSLREGAKMLGSGALQAVGKVGEMGVSAAKKANDLGFSAAGKVG